MMKLSFAHARKKTRAQGMVEFALALPVLLLVIYGMIETGRLLFIYASTVTASRQAARYGAGVGVNNSGVPHYQDCDGIISAVNNVAFLNAFSDIQVNYDRGLKADGTVKQIANPDPNCSQIVSYPLRNGDRIKVRVSSVYSPILPILPIQPFTITSMSSHTLLVSVSIGSDATPQSWSGNGFSLAVAASPSTYSAVGEAIVYTYTLKNAGTTDIIGPYTVTDDRVSGIDCSGAASPLTGGGSSTTCTGVYYIVQSDLDAGFITDAAVAAAAGSLDTSNQSGTTIAAIQLPALSLAKTANPTAAPVSGMVVTYTYTITNSGNVTLTSPYDVSDDRVNSGGISCSGAASSLAPGASTACTGTYTIKNTDITAGFVTNNATATATFVDQEPESNTATATVVTKPLVLSISASPFTVTTLGQVITYTYNLKNVASFPLSSPYVVTDSLVVPVSCAGATSPLNTGASTTCTGTHVVSQADLDAGEITNSATATANSASGVVISNQADGTVVATQTRLLTLTKTASLATAYAPTGKTIVYTYTIHNGGNVTVTSPYTVTDNKIAIVNCAAAVSPLIPGASTTCTASYATVQADIDNGWIINTASVTAQAVGQTVTSNQASASVSTYNGVRLTLEKSASPTEITQGAGQTISYTYTLKNTGNVALTSPYAVTDDKIVGVDCSGAASPLAPGASTTCTAGYLTDQADVTAGSVTNQASATAKSSVSPFPVISSAAVTVTVPVSAPVACDIRHSSLKTSPYGMTIFNNNGYIITIQSIQIFYNSSQPSGQGVKQVVLGGAAIWTGSQTGSPITFTTFTGSPTIPANSTKLLQFAFLKNYNANGTERLLVTFTTNGCAVLDSANSGQLP
jgi:uncharacterized repeat protein (TIGR01451 family)